MPRSDQWRAGDRPIEKGLGVLRPMERLRASRPTALAPAHSAATWLGRCGAALRAVSSEHQAPAKRPTTDRLRFGSFIASGHWWRYDRRKVSGNVRSTNWPTNQLVGMLSFNTHCINSFKAFRPLENKLYLGTLEDKVALEVRQSTESKVSF